MRLLRRTSIIMLGYLVAVLIATAVFAIATHLSIVFHPAMAGTPAPPLLQTLMMILRLAAYAFVPILAAAFIPSLIVVAVSELFRLRSLLFYGIAGGAIGAAAILSVKFVLSLIMFRPKPPALGFAMSFTVPWFILFAGLVAGLAYWTIAGRNAGSWRTMRAGT